MFGWFHNNSQSTAVESNGEYFGSDTAVVVEAIAGPHGIGRIRCKGGVLWPGVCGQVSTTLVPGQRVRLLKRTGNTWSVRPF